MTMPQLESHCLYLSVVCCNKESLHVLIYCEPIQMIAQALEIECGILSHKLDCASLARTAFLLRCCLLAQVITKRDKEGHRLEPFEEALVEVPEEFVGPVVDLLGSRKGQMVDMNASESGLTRVTYVMPTR